jgi:diacylglycerol kinase
MQTNQFSLAARLRSFRYAFNGLSALFRTEHNAYIHLAFSVLVIMLCIFVKVSRVELLALGSTMSLVWMAEIFNTAIEKAMDFISRERHPEIRVVKDLAAAAVLVTAIAAFAIGSVIFIPKFF